MLSQLSNLSNQNTTEVIFYTGLFILPFIFLPGYQPAFEVPRVIFLFFWVELLTLSIVISKQSISLKSLQLKLILFLFATALISSLVGVNFYKSIIGNYYRLDGILTLIHLITLSLISTSVFSRDGLSKTIKVLYYSGFIVSFLVSLKYLISLTYLQIDLLKLIDGNFFGNPNFLAGYLLVTFVLSLEALKNKLSKIDIVYFLLILISLLETESQSAIALFIFTIISLILSQTFKVNTVRVFLLFIAMFIALFIYKVNAAYDPQHPFESRVRIFEKSVLAFYEKPFLGWGWANFDMAFESVDWPLKFERDVYVDKAHSSIMEYLVTTGIVGLFSFIILSFNTIKILFNKNTRYALIAFILLLVHAQTNIISITNEVYYWLLVGYTSTE